jgi:carboxypeptidase Taq
VDAQRALVTGVLEAHGFDRESWRLDPTLHPFAQSLGVGDTRITTHYDPTTLDMALYSSLHEFGHGLYEAGIDPALARTPLGETISLGVHESQSRLWENVVGRSREFCGWVAPRLASAFPEQLGGLTGDALFRDVTRVRPSLVRIHADEATYNLHVVLRTDLETRLFSGGLSVDDLPGAWDAGMHELLGVEVPDAAHGVLQDIHWGAGLMGYFPTYAIGNLMCAQFWEAARRELPGVEAGIAGGDTAALREWLRDRIHRHGRTFAPRELLARVTGEPLSVEPFLRYLREKLTDAGHLPA